MEKKTSTLADGTIIPRIFEDESLEQKRLDAINRLGTKWILHPVHSIKKLKTPYNGDSVFKKKVMAHQKALAKKYKVAA